MKYIQYKDYDMLHYTSIQDNLQQLIKTPDSRVLISSSKGWIVIHSFDISTRILCEIASNHHLHTDLHLDASTIQIFEDKKYITRREGTSRGKLLTLNDTMHSDFIEELLFIARCYESDMMQWNISFTPSCRHNLKNPKISGQMRILSQKRDQSSRIQLYQLLLNAELLFHVHNNKPKSIGTIGKFDSFALFTEDKFYYHYDPTGIEVVRQYGYEIFQILSDVNAGSVWINPKCLVGGELYQNEIEMLAKAVYRR